MVRFITNILFKNKFKKGTRNIMFAMTAIRGIGRRFSNLICKKADIDLSKVIIKHDWL